METINDLEHEEKEKLKTSEKIVSKDSKNHTHAWESFDNIAHDKNFVIVAVTIIAVTSLLLLRVNAKDIIMASITGLFGIAVGKNLK